MWLALRFVKSNNVDFLNQIRYFSMTGIPLEIVLFRTADMNGIYVVKYLHPKTGLEIFKIHLLITHTVSSRPCITFKLHIMSKLCFAGKTEKY